MTKRWMLVLVTVAACAAPPAAVEPTGVEAAALTGCRSTCFALDRLSCADVETTCGHNHGVLVLDGLPFNCTDAEPMACHYRDGTLDACLAQCGGEDAPGNAGEGLAQRPRPDPFGQGASSDPDADGDVGGDPQPPL